MYKFKFSIIVPCYNVEKYIDECMESILKQSLGVERLQIILVDDASTDQTREKLRYYADEYPDNIIVVLCDINGRQGTARNIGMQYAEGEYISFVDADDLISLNMYNILNKVAEKLSPDIIKFKYTAKKIEIKKNQECIFRYYDLRDIELRKKLLFDQNILNESCTMKVYRKSLIDKSGVYFAERVSYEEPLFTYPLNFYANSIAVSDIYLYYYRFNSEGTTVKQMKKLQSIVDHMAVQLETYETMCKTNFYDSYRDEIDLYFIQSFLVENFYFLKNRGLTMPVEYFRYCAEIINNKIPDYRKNRYWSNYMKSEIAIIFHILQESSDLSDTELENRIIEGTRNLKLFTI